MNDFFGKMSVSVYKCSRLQYISDYFGVFFNHSFKKSSCITFNSNRYLNVRDLGQIIDILSQLNMTTINNETISIQNLAVFQKLKKLSYYSLAYFTDYFGVSIIRLWLLQTVNANILDIGKIVFAFKIVDPNSSFLTEKLQNFLVKFLVVEPAFFEDIYFDQYSNPRGHNALSKMIRDRYRCMNYIDRNNFTVVCYFCNLAEFMHRKKYSSMVLLKCCHIPLHKYNCLEYLRFLSCPNCGVECNDESIQKYDVYCEFARRETKKNYPSIMFNKIKIYTSYMNY